MRRITTYWINVTIGISTYYVDISVYDVYKYCFINFINKNNNNLINNIDQKLTSGKAITWLRYLRKRITYSVLQYILISNREDSLATDKNVKFTSRTMNRFKSFLSFSFMRKKKSWPIGFFFLLFLLTYAKESAPYFGFIRCLLSVGY